MVRLLTLTTACFLAGTWFTYAQDKCPTGEHIVAMSFERDGDTIGYMAIDTQTDMAFRCSDANNTWKANYAETGDGGFTFLLKTRNGTWPRTMQPNASGVVEDTWFSGGRPFRMFVVESGAAR